jgi:hypothetical protein
VHDGSTCAGSPVSSAAAGPFAGDAAAHDSQRGSATARRHAGVARAELAPVRPADDGDDEPADPGASSGPRSIGTHRE